MKTARHERGGGGSSHQGTANGQAKTTKEAKARGERRIGRPTTQTTHSAEAQGTQGPKPEKAGDNGGAQREKKQKKRSPKRQRRKPRDTKGRGGAATTREQPTARRETQTRRERTESRAAGGQQNKQHTAPRPAAAGAGNQRKPETTGAPHKKKKQGTGRRRRKARDTNEEGGGGGGNHQGAANGPAEDTNEARAHGEPRSVRSKMQTTHSAEAQGTRGRKPKKARENRGAEGRKKEKKGGGGAKQHRPAGGGGKENKAPRPKAPGAGNQRTQETMGAPGNNKRRKTKRTKKGATPARRGPSKGDRHSGQRKGEAQQNVPGRLARPTRPDERAHTHAHGTRACRPPTRKGRCRRPHETAQVHRPSPPSNDGRYGKPDRSVTGSTHANHRSARSPRPLPEGTRQGQPHRGAPNEYDAVRAQRPCLSRG